MKKQYIEVSLTALVPFDHKSIATMSTAVATAEELEGALGAIPVPGNVKVVIEKRSISRKED